MRISKYLYSIVALVVLLSVSACGEEQPTPVPPVAKSEITLDKSVVEVSAAGGECKVDYFIKNRVEDAELELTSNADWVDDLVVSHTFVGFTVAANEGAERDAQITLSYNGESATIDIHQAEYSANRPFTITIESLSSTTCVTRVDAVDDTMEYIMYLSEVSYFSDNGITTAEELLEDDYQAFIGGSLFDEITVKEYLRKYKALFSGTTRAEWSNLRPGVKSVLYVYGVEFNDDGSDYEVVTDIVFEVIEPQMAELYDVEFDVTLNIEGPDVEFDVDTNGWEGYYAIEVMTPEHQLYLDEGAEVDDAYCNKLFMWWMNNCDVYRMYLGMSNNDILDTFCYKGSGRNSKELAATTSYAALVFAIEEREGVLQVVSRPELLYFTTGGVEPSDMQISFEFDNLHSRVIDVRVVPTVDDDKYLFLLTPTSYITSTSDQDIIEEIINDYISYAYFFKGPQTMHISTLKPEEEYSMFAFGLHGSVVTTPLFRCDFTTEAAAAGTVNVERVEIGGPYNPGDLAEAMPELYGRYASYADECYIISMQTITDAPSREKFYMCWDCVTYDYYSVRQPSIILDDLIAFYCEPVGLSICSFGEEYLVSGVAMDECGNLSEMWLSERFAYTADDYVPVDDLVEKLRAQPATSHVAESLVYSR